jgi:hypothetical protein
MVQKRKKKRESERDRQRKKERERERDRRRGWGIFSSFSLIAKVVRAPGMMAKHCRSDTLYAVAISALQCDLGN